MKKRIIVGLLLISLTMIPMQSGRVHGQNNANPPIQIISRTYDINDLLFVSNDYPLSSDFVPLTQINKNTASAGQWNGQGNENLYQSQVQAAQGRSNRMDEIKSYITQNVDPSSWKDNGGDVGSITSSPLRAQFTISSTPENHKQIEKLLAESRTYAHQQIRIRADWLLLSPGEVEKLQKNGVDDTAVVPEISRERLRTLPQGTVHYTGTITGFSGQTVHIASGRARSVVTNLTPIVAPSAVAMDPSVVFVQEGVSLQVNATLTGDSAIVDLSSVVTEPNKAVNPPTTQPAMQALEHIDSVLQHLRTTVTVPLNKPVLVGGATANPNADAPAGKLLYLIIEADAAGK